MIKRFISPLNNEKGIIFPWVYTMGSLLILTCLFTAQEYKNQLISTKVVTEYHQLQSLFHYSHDQLLLKLNEHTAANEIVNDHFTLPLGEAFVQCNPEGDGYSCTWQLSLNGGAVKHITRSYRIDAHKTR
ncbi:hypothetical protein MUO14_01640 [Halobacillus shinanisalinarum]|uniref:Competence protein ComGG n=1 Tax=Halobacillus shinanisalinarum TaxID=2932258 RepID=A0ABY4H050_9BACI|nr:hypothetical protein [Halobacillus shinanisalinarum]UOQ93728.1 hypothetical protein MUO14_01640 [Halobacillus shinanisalinarum]